MYLDSIALTRTLPCLAEPGKIIVIGKPNRSLDAAIPYLATLPSVIAYNPETLTLTFRRQPGFITLYPEKVYITKVHNSEEGLELLKNLAAAINATWDRREELNASTRAQRAPGWLDILTQLPQSNCKQCGLPTCMAFAAALLQNNAVLTDCIPLVSDPAFGERRAALEAML